MISGSSSNATDATIHGDSATHRGANVTTGARCGAAARRGTLCRRLRVLLLLLLRPAPTVVRVVMMTRALAHAII